MSRPNKPRQVLHEAHAAQRIRIERERLDLSYERLAEKMTEAGCAMQGSAIFKIENGRPPRRITLDEAVTFSQVLGVKLHDLLVPPAVAASREALKLWHKWEGLRDSMNRIAGETYEVEVRLSELIAQDDAVREALGGEHGDAALLIPRFSTGAGSES
jgi:transcriptional regulator with XRE-family HTH domain